MERIAEATGRLVMAGIEVEKVQCSKFNHTAGDVLNDIVPPLWGDRLGRILKYFNSLPEVHPSSKLTDRSRETIQNSMRYFLKWLFVWKGVSPVDVHPWVRESSRPTFCLLEDVLSFVYVPPPEDVAAKLKLIDPYLASTTPELAWAWVSPKHIQRF